MKAILWRWGPALLIMAVIFVASAQPKANIPQYGAYDWDVKKTAHVLLYGLLAVAYLHGLANGQRPRSGQVVQAVLLAGLYGATDEFHQTFVAGRGATAVDVMIDTVGATAGVALRQAWRAARQRPA